MVAPPVSIWLLMSEPLVVALLIIVLSSQYNLKLKKKKPTAFDISHYIMKL